MGLRPYVVHETFIIATRDDFGLTDGDGQTLTEVEGFRVVPSTQSNSGELSVDRLPSVLKTISY